MLKTKIMTDQKVILTIDENGLVSGAIPETLAVCNERPLKITIKAEAAVNMEVRMKSPIDLIYVFEPLCEVKLIEVRQFETGGTMKHQMIAKENSKILAVFLKEGNHSDELMIEEENHLAKDANMEVSYGEIGDGNVRANYTYELDAPGASAHLHLAAIACQKDQKKFQVTLNHHAPYTYGMMENYGVSRHQAMLVFDGVGRIDKGMHQSESHQTSRIIVFEQGCIARANPYLFIDDYDVKASHAASVGAMNEEHLYYLQSRGLTKKQAMHLITLGYLIPAINVLNDEELVERFEHMLLGKVGEA